MPRKNPHDSGRRFAREYFEFSSRYVGGLKRVANEYGLIVKCDGAGYWISGEPDMLMRFKQIVARELLCGKQI